MVPAMPTNDASILPQPNPEHRRIAASQFERANQVIATGNFDYGIRLLLSCCKLDPANLIYRQTLRRTEKTKYRNNLRGSWLAGVTTWPIRARLKAAKTARDWLKVLEVGEQVLVRNPWDTGAQMDMAEAADVLGLLDLAIWSLEQARQKNPRDVSLNRTLARFYEKRGNFTQAIALWELIRRAAPADVEAQHKAKDLAANETIARGQYEAAVGGQSPLRPDVDTQEESAPAEAARTTEAPAKAPAAREPAAKPPGAREPAAKAPGAREPTAKGLTPPPPDRLGGEAAKLRVRIEADPTNANAYLHLAAYYRRLGQLEQARDLL